VIGGLGPCTAEVAGRSQPGAAEPAREAGGASTWRPRGQSWRSPDLGDHARQGFGGVERDGFGGGAEDVLERGGGGDVDDGHEIGEGGSALPERSSSANSPRRTAFAASEKPSSRGLHLLEQAELGGELGDLAVLLGDGLLQARGNR
jgi:hypothetical protein